MKNKILVLSRKVAEGYDWYGRDIAIISVTDPNQPSAKLNYFEDKILRLQFHDVDKDMKMWTPNGTVRIFTINDSQVKDIVQFVDKYFYNVDEFVIHCEAGISRSAGIAAAIAKYIYLDDTEYFKKYIPNRTVHRLVLNEFYKLKETII